MYSRSDKRSNYIINASLPVTINGIGNNGGDTFTIVLDPDSRLIIESFNNNANDLIDLQYFPDLTHFRYLNLTEPQMGLVMWL